MGIRRGVGSEYGGTSDFRRITCSKPNRPMQPHNFWYWSGIDRAEVEHTEARTLQKTQFLNGGPAKERCEQVRNNVDLLACDVIRNRVIGEISLEIARYWQQCIIRTMLGAVAWLKRCGRQCSQVKIRYKFKLIYLKDSPEAKEKAYRGGFLIWYKEKSEKRSA